eukprot:1971955-Amphidinium_carterae.1
MSCIFCRNAVSWICMPPDINAMGAAKTTTAISSYNMSTSICYKPGNPSPTSPPKATTNFSTDFKGAEFA